MRPIADQQFTTENIVHVFKEFIVLTSDGVIHFFLRLHGDDAENYREEYTHAEKYEHEKVSVDDDGEHRPSKCASVEMDQIRHGTVIVGAL